jgi:hypothetical protein
LDVAREWFRKKDNVWCPVCVTDTPLPVAARVPWHGYLARRKVEWSDGHTGEIGCRQTHRRSVHDLSALADDASPGAAYPRGLWEFIGEPFRNLLCRSLVMGRAENNPKVRRCSAQPVSETNQRLVDRVIEPLGERDG